MPIDLSSFLVFDLSAFVTSSVLRFSVYDAIGTVPVFLALTSELQEHRKQIVKDSVIIIATVVLLVFATAATLIFQVLGMTLSGLKIAGGIILFLIALDNLSGRLSQTRAIAAGEIAALPLATPLLAGPGAISTVIIFPSPPLCASRRLRRHPAQPSSDLRDLGSGELRAEDTGPQRHAGLHEGRRASDICHRSSVRPRGGDLRDTGGVPRSH
jgi:hypothetical protein